MTAARFGSPIEDPAAALARCEERNYNVEGIETYLVLEDGDGRPLLQQAGGDSRWLAELATGYLERRAADPASPTEAELGCALEVLAAHHFEPQGDHSR